LGFNEALHLRCLPQKSSQMFDALIDALFQTQSINLRFHTASVVINPQAKTPPSPRAAIA
jgi:hypothetical protein